MGYVDNFAWGCLSLNSGVTVTIGDGNAASGAALYVGVVELADGPSQLTSIYSDYNIYYDPALPENAYLANQTYALNGSGALEPVPEAPTLLLLLLGALPAIRRKR